MKKYKPVVSTWIDAEERLPELEGERDRTTVMVCDDRGRVFALRYERTRIRGKLVDRWVHTYDNLYYGKVVAWMKLPTEPPTEINEKDWKLLEEVVHGLRCCKDSMSNDDPFVRCKECPYNKISIDVDDCRSVLCDQALKFLEPAGVYECFHCGHRAVVWGADFSFDEYGMDGEGIIQECTCANCGANIRYMIPIREEGADEE